jgi:hypothetical protein
MLLRVALSLALIAATPLIAQTTEPTIHTAADLQPREAKLIETAAGGPHLGRATKSSAPYLDFERWILAGAITTPANQAIYHSPGKRNKPANRNAPIPKHTPTAISFT